MSHLVAFGTSGASTVALLTPLATANIINLPFFLFLSLLFPLYILSTPCPSSFPLSFSQFILCFSCSTVPFYSYATWLELWTINPVWKHTVPRAIFTPWMFCLDRKQSWCLILWTMDINGRLSETHLCIVIEQDKGIGHHKFFLIHLKTCLFQAPHYWPNRKD